MKMLEKKGKSAVVAISSSEDEQEKSDSGEDDDSIVEATSSTSCDEDDESDWSRSLTDEYEEDEFTESEENDEEIDNSHEGEEPLCDKVTRLLREKADLEELKLVECKAYLRSLGLRLSGTKADCIKRIMEHWRIRDGNGEKLYPRSSFSIDCTGDVCKGDVVLFSQKVYKKFDRATRHGALLGKRTIAGRVVKESYGAQKQQHTFTVEVLWSKGIKKLPPLFPLLVKGRNLYKLKTFRQPWKNEKDRFRVLDEKHRRGAAARHVREMRRGKILNTDNVSSSHRGTKRPKHYTHSAARKRQVVQNTHSTAHKRQMVQNEKMDPAREWQKPPARKQKGRGHQNGINRDRRLNLKRSDFSCQSNSRNAKVVCLNQFGQPFFELPSYDPRSAKNKS